jgi:hypothetical protein
MFESLSKKKICLNQLISFDVYIIVIYQHCPPYHIYNSNLNDKRVGHANDPVLFTAIIKYFNLEWLVVSS